MDMAMEGRRETTEGRVNEPRRVFSVTLLVPQSRVSAAMLARFTWDFSKKK